MQPIAVWCGDNHNWEDTGREKSGHKEQKCSNCGKTRWVKI